MSSIRIKSYLPKIVDYEAFELKNGIINMKIELKNFEDKYDMSTKDFYQEFESGSLGDDKDYMIWAGTYEMLLGNRERLEELA